MIPGRPLSRLRVSASLAAVVCVAFAALVLSAGARAATSPTATATPAASTAAPAVSTATPAPLAAAALTTQPPGTAVLVSSQTKPPPGYRLTADQVLAIARRDPRVQAELHKHPRAVPYEYTHTWPNWQVSWFSVGRTQSELMQVYVDDQTGQVTQVWTGFQVPWTMARGYPGAFGRRVNALYIWIPLCLLFMAPFIPWRRRPSLLHLDLLMLLGFSISLALFNHAQIGLSVPLVYPFLIYLLIRMLMLGFGRGRPREPLHTIVPAPWLAVGTVFLMAFRIGLNILNSNVIDVGFAGVIGADKLIHGHALYGGWPADNMYGDTYGPVNYYAYVPFRLIFGWSGLWDSLPAAHAASICFDLATLAGLIVLGRRLRGNGLAALLAYGWAAYPFTLYAMNSNTNDSLVSALVVLALLVVTSAPGRGVVAGLAGLTKFAPFALAPLLLRGTDEHPRERSVAAYILAFALTVFVVMLPVLFGHNLSAFWHDSIEYQSNRMTPFSVYGLWGGLGFAQHLLQGCAVGLAVLVAFVPARRGVVEIAALSAAVLIALQLTDTYWLYPYIVWFFPSVLVAVLASHPDRVERFEEQAWSDPRPLARPPAPGEADPIPIRITPAP